LKLRWPRAAAGKGRRRQVAKRVNLRRWRNGVKARWGLDLRRRVRAFWGPAPSCSSSSSSSSSIGPLNTRFEHEDDENDSWRNIRRPKKIKRGSLTDQIRFGAREWPGASQPRPQIRQRPHGPAEGLVPASSCRQVFQSISTPRAKSTSARTGDNHLDATLVGDRTYGDSLQPLSDGGPRRWQWLVSLLLRFAANGKMRRYRAIQLCAELNRIA